MPYQSSDNRGCKYVDPNYRKRLTCVSLGECGNSGKDMKNQKCEPSFYKVITQLVYQLYKQTETALASKCVNSNFEPVVQSGFLDHKVDYQVQTLLMLVSTPCLVTA